LAGHTGARILLPILARRPAPLQVSWLGYPNSTGLSALDYRLTDPLVDPEGEGDQYYSERLVRLPGGFLCYLPPEDAPEPAPAPAANNGFVTFGSFNMLPKLSGATIALWSRIMLRVPKSRLVLKSQPLADQRTRMRVLSAFARYGIAEERITLSGALPSFSEHLAHYRCIDLALDTFPYNGTTTTCEALWMGVPVLALDGDRHAGRVAGSLLRRLGLDELVAHDADEYLERAVALAASPGRLAGYRATLRPLMAGSPLCDGARFAAEVEKAYREMWQSPSRGSQSAKTKA
jgi:predicted O-linked N-acetylglucosamine transferase (SPINDLY family)